MTEAVKTRQPVAQEDRDRARWRGIHAVMVTPFHADLALDEQGLRRNVEFLANSAVDAILCLGSEGEFYAMGDDERRRVTEVTAETLAGRRPLAVGVSHSSAVQAALLARHAASVGADAVLATAPFFGRSSISEVRAHFAMIAEVGLPVFVYNSPSRVGYGLVPADIASIAAIPGVIGVKQAAPDILELVELLSTLDGTDCLVLGGAENTIWPALAVGAMGNTATAASAIPGVFARMWQFTQAERLSEARELYGLLTPLRRAYAMAGGQAAVVKRLMERAGLSGGPVRPPARHVDSAVEKLLDQLVTSLKEAGLWTS